MLVCILFGFEGGLQGGPGATGAAWDMGKVCDDQGLVVGSLTLDSHTISTGAVGVQKRGSVDAHADSAPFIADQAKLLRLLLVDVVDEAICQLSGA